MRKTSLYTILFAFLFGQVIQLVTNAMAHYLYVSDPVVMCITVGIVTTALVVMTSIFTLMETQEHPAHEAKPWERDKSPLAPIFIGKKEPLDTEPEDIDEIDRNLRRVLNQDRG